MSCITKNLLTSKHFKREITKIRLELTMVQIFENFRISENAETAITHGAFIEIDFYQHFRISLVKTLRMSIVMPKFEALWVSPRKLTGLL